MKKNGVTVLTPDLYKKYVKYVETSYGRGYLKKFRNVKTSDSIMSDVRVSDKPEQEQKKQQLKTQK